MGFGLFISAIRYRINNAENTIMKLLYPFTAVDY
jgi:hypothetical protein